MKDQFLKAVPILQKIESYGYEAYFVGGSIRDSLLNRPIADVDIATSATPEEIKTIFDRTVDVGIEHGTVLVLHNNVGYEVTTFRSESEYKDYRHPEKVEFIRSLQMDLERRDFTMNAIAMDRHGELRDPFDGKIDIERRNICTVGEAKCRFHEDALRMMRAVRFVSQLEFSIDENTELALYQNASLLKFIAIERITNEFVKLLKGTAKSKALSILIQSTLVDYMPRTSETKYSLTKCIEYNIDCLTENQMWLLILYFQSGEPSDYLKEWRFPNQKIKYLTKCLLSLKNRVKKEWSVVTLYPLHIEMATDIETVYRILNNQNMKDLHNEMASKFDKLIIKSRDELAVKGSDLIKWFNRPPGPWIKATLDKIEEAVLLKIVINNKDAIKRWILKRAITNENETD